MNNPTRFLRKRYPKYAKRDVVNVAFMSSLERERYAAEYGLTPEDIAESVELRTVRPKVIEQGDNHRVMPKINS